MKFYDQLIEIYDIWHPWKLRLKNEIPFYEQLFQELRATKLVDMGCGTGRLAVELASRGYSVTAVDSSNALLEETKRYASQHDVELTVLRGDFTQPIEGIQSEADVLLCVAGTVSHLFDRKNLTAFLQQARTILRPGGAMVIHLPNMERLLGHKPKYLPIQAEKTSDGREILFLTVYDYSASRLAMDLVAIERRGEEWKQHVHHTALYPWTAQEIIDALQEVGFVEPLTYGNFDYCEFDSSRHDNLVIVAENSENEV